MAKMQNCYIEKEERRIKKIELKLRNLEFNVEPEKKNKHKIKFIPNGTDFTLIIRDIEDIVLLSFTKE